MRAASAHRARRRDEPVSAGPARRRHGRRALTAVVLLACAPSSPGLSKAPAEGAKSPATPDADAARTHAANPTPAAAGEPVLATRYYALHSDPWINLHHFLYQWSRAERGIGEGRQHVPVPEREGPLAEGAAAGTWSDAVAFYAANVAERDHFDEAMLDLKTGLLGLGGDPAAKPPDEIPGIAAHLAAAMRVYLEQWWPEHDRSNRRWIEHVSGDLAQYEERWVETARRVFGGEWPAERQRVDAAAYANWAGGYTSNFPGHTVIWSTDPTNLEGLYGLELLFHEPGHLTSLAGPLRDTVREVFREAGVREPRNLRHALLFAASGELVKMIAEERGLPEHVPYVESEGLTGFAGWREVWPTVRERWLPVVRGEGDPREAIRAMTEDLRG